MLSDTSVLTVKQLNTYVKSLIDGDAHLNYVSVCGEIASLRRYASGHVYFTLKDADTSLKAVMFSSSAARLPLLPNEGDLVICTGKISVYERDGVYQLICDNITAKGYGDLAVKFEMLKLKLYSEGLFAAEHKKEILPYPKKIALITSPDGAAVHDFITVAQRRYPLCEIVIYPSLVQGDSAPQTLINSLKLADRDNNDIIVITRGGGSKEDLAAFNDELLAREIYAANTPVVSAVGHEIDFSICDFVSDKRCPTPSAAAEEILPDTTEILRYFANTKNSIAQNFTKIIEQCVLRLTRFKNSYVFTSPEKTYLGFEQKIKELKTAILNAYSNVIEKNLSTVNAIKSKLCALDPTNVLKRGYSVVYDNGVPVKDHTQINENDRLLIKTYTGVLTLTAKDIKAGENNG